MSKKNISKNTNTERLNSEVLRTVSKLINDIAKADQAYHGEDRPKITDADYDKLKIDLNELKKSYPAILDLLQYRESIGGATAQGFDKVKHSAEMLSLNNGLTSEDIYNFGKSIRSFLGLTETDIIWFCSEPKIDGLSLSLRYESGTLVQAVTRGDGLYGENVTGNALTIYNIPQKINLKMDVLEVRGEVYIGKKDFLELNKNQVKKGEKAFANPRNAAAGSLRQLNPEKTRGRRLAFFPFSVGESSEPLVNSHYETLAMLKGYGFSINPWSRRCKTIEDLLTHYNELVLARSELDYDIDGMVYKVDSIELQKRLGNRSTSPRWAIAHKFPAQTAITQIEHIDIQVGRTGSLSPVARLKPVNIGGVIVSNATLHNEDYISGVDSNGKKIRNGSDIRIGDFVEVFRAGDVIPKVSSVILGKRSSQSKKYKFPDFCPVCGARAIKQMHDSVKRCTGGMACRAQAIEKIIYFVSKRAFDIEGLGKKNVESFYDRKWIQYPSDIFLLERNFGFDSPSKLQDLDGWGSQSAKKLFAAIDTARQIDLPRLIYSFGIRFVGYQVSVLLSRYYGNWEIFLDQVRKATNNDTEEWSNLAGIDGIGTTIASSIIDFFRSSESHWITEKLIRELRLRSFSAQKVKVSPISDLVIVFTGTLEKITRSEVKARTEELGGKVTSAISKNTDILVVGNNAGSKLKRANQLGVRVLSEDEWMKLLEGTI